MIGGAIYLQGNSKISVNDTIFEQNFGDYGSAITFTELITCDSINLFNLNFIENQAYTTGNKIQLEIFNLKNNFGLGTIHFINSSPPCIDFCDDCEYHGNTALYGPEISTGRNIIIIFLRNF